MSRVREGGERERERGGGGRNDSLVEKHGYMVELYRLQSV